MSAYITSEQYAAYHGEAIPTDLFPQYALRASEAVDAACHWAIGTRGFENFPAFDQAQIVLACCAQAEYLWLQGVETALAGANAGGGGYQIGKTQIVAGGAQLNPNESVRILCQKALDALWPTGLLYAGTGVAL